MISLRMAARNISRRKSRNTLTLLAIILGTALLVGVNIATTSAVAEFQRYLNRFWGETDMFVRYVGNAPMNEGNITSIREASEMIQEVTARVGSWSIPGPALVFINNDRNKIVGIVGITEEDFEYAIYNVTGSRNVSGENVVIGNKIAEKYGVKVNDAFSLTIETKSETKNYTLKAIGIYYPTPPTTSVDVLMDLQKAQELTGLEEKVSLILVKIKDSSKVIETRDLLQKELGAEYEVLAPKIEALQRIQSQLAGFQLGLNIMIMVSLLVCGFLVFNTMFMAVKERTYEIGVLRTVGASRRHVFLVFLEESLLLGVVGAVIGIFAGLVLSNLFVFVLETGAFQGIKITGLTLTQDSVIIGLIGGLLAVVGGALYPAASASRVNILQALRPEMRVERKIPDSISLVAGLLLFFIGVALVFGVFPFSLPFMDMFLIPVGLIIFATVSVKKASKILVKPIKLLTDSIGMLLSKSVAKKLLRNAVSFGMIGISLTFTIMLGGVQAGMADALESGVREALGADIMLLSNQTLPVAFKDNLTILDERIQSVAPMSLYWAGTRVFRGENQSGVAVIVVEPETFHGIIKYQFVDSPKSEEVYSRLASKNESLLLPEGLAKKLNVSVGSTLGIVTPMYGPRDFTVEGIFTGAALQFISFGFRPMSESIIISFKSEGAYFYGKNEAIIFFVNLKDDFKQQASNVVDSINSAYLQYNFGEQSTTLQDLLVTVRTQIDNIFSIFHLILYFAILISTIGIAIIMIMNVTERRREIGLLRSQGMSRSQILSMLLAEACFMGVIGFLIGLPCGLLLLKSVTSTATITGFWIPYIIPWSTIVEALAFAVIASLAGAFYPAFKASKMNITRALQQR